MKSILAKLGVAFGVAIVTGAGATLGAIFINEMFNFTVGRHSRPYKAGERKAAA